MVILQQIHEGPRPFIYSVITYILPLCASNCSGDASKNKIDKVPAPVELTAGN